jgi:hypothetical protein
MPRNFGLRRHHDTFREFWNGPSPEHRDDPVWPIYVILAAVLIILAVGVFA